MSKQNNNGSAQEVVQATRTEFEVARISIKPPNYRVAKIEIRGTALLVQLQFDEKIEEEMRKRQEAGEQSRKGRARQAKDFSALFHRAYYRGPNGEYGIPASAFRNAMIDACRMAGFKMTHAKMSVFIVADFCDRKGKPLVALRGGDPEELVSGVRNATGVIDLRPRAMWREWSCIVPVQFNADQFALVDIVNLLSHAGIAVGIGEGRPFSRNSAGCGWGTFEVVTGMTG
jgi:hypothetical protein